MEVVHGSEKTGATIYFSNKTMAIENQIPSDRLNTVLNKSLL